MLIEQKQYPILWKAFVGITMTCLFGVYLFNRGLKEKKEFMHYKGRIVYYSATLSIYPIALNEKYLQIDTYDRIFYLFDPGVDSDSLYFFKAAELSPGDTIDIYFDENSFEKDQRVNRCVRNIDKNNKPIYVHIRSDKAMGIGFISFGIIFMIVLIILRAKNLIT